MGKAHKKIRILLTGGGTGGHIYPLAAVATALREQIITLGREADIRYFGDPKYFRHVLELAEVRIIHITSSKWRRYLDLQNIFDIFRFKLSIIQSLWKIFWFMPDACFSKGGPGAFAVVAISRLYAIPVVIHESDAVPGITTRLSAKFAKRIELAFAAAADILPKKAVTNVVGNPIRPELLAPVEPHTAKLEFKFERNEPVVLFLCGSQGAERINNFVLEHIVEFTEHFQILHQTGPANHEMYREQYKLMAPQYPKHVSSRYRFVPYFDRNVAAAYAAADLVVARAGAGGIFELATLGKPSVLVPIPESANNHQLQNAYTYEHAGATVVIEEANMLPSLLIQEITKILTNQSKRAAMSNAARKFSVPDSAKLIAGDILSLVK